MRGCCATKMLITLCNPWRFLVHVLIKDPFMKAAMPGLPISFISKVSVGQQP